MNHLHITNGKITGMITVLIVAALIFPQNAVSDASITTNEAYNITETSADISLHNPGVSGTGDCVCIDTVNPPTDPATRTCNTGPWWADWSTSFTSLTPSTRYYAAGCVISGGVPAGFGNVVQFDTLTPTPTPTPTPDVTPTPIVSEGNIEGDISGDQGEPITNAVVYIFQQMPTSNSATALVSGLKGMSSVLTDSDGKFLFQQLTSGTYTIIPNSNGYTFNPTSLQSSDGAYAGSILATTNNLYSTGCTVTQAGEQIVASDAKAAALLSFIKRKVAIYSTMANQRKGLAPKRRDALIASLQQAEARAENTFSQILNLSLSLPKVVLADCPTENDCQQTDYTPSIRSYRGVYLSNLKRLSFFVLRRARETLGRTLIARKGVLIRKARRYHTAARKKSAQLPASNYVCPAPMA